MEAESTIAVIDDSDESLSPSTRALMASVANDDFDWLNASETPDTKHPTGKASELDFIKSGGNYAQNVCNECQCSETEPMANICAPAGRWQVPECIPWPPTPDLK